MSSTGLKPAGDVIDRVAGGVWKASSFPNWQITQYLHINLCPMIMEWLVDG